MKTTFQRIINITGYQIGSLGAIIPVVSLITGHGFSTLGLLTVFITTFCTCWNYLFSYWFDLHLDAKGRVHERTVKDRMFHALGLEVGIIWFTTPVIAWWLDIGLVEAIVMDLGLIIAYLVYTFVYNWMFDKYVMPVLSVKTKVLKQRNSLEGV